MTRRSRLKLCVVSGAVSWSCFALAALFCDQQGKSPTLDLVLSTAMFFLWLGDVDRLAGDQ